MKILAVTVLLATVMLYNTKNELDNPDIGQLRVLETQHEEPIKLEFIDLADLDLSSDEYVKLQDHWVYKNVLTGDVDTSIKGNLEVDLYIQKLAEQRGYKKRPVADELMLVNFQGHRFQQDMLDSWVDLQTDAKKDNVYLNLISVYRSPKDQKNIFNTTLGSLYTNQQILELKADTRINQILTTRSIPGYSKHHTGYTLDITDASIGNNFTKFRETQGYTWLSADNFKMAREFGFVPSYPENASNMGPNPEAWEYVYIGRDIPVVLLDALEIEYEKGNDI